MGKDKRRGYRCTLFRHGRTTLPRSQSGWRRRHTSGHSLDARKQNVAAGDLRTQRRSGRRRMPYRNDRPVPQVIRREMLDAPPPTNRERDTLSWHVNIPKASTAVAGRIGKAVFSRTVPRKTARTDGSPFVSRLAENYSRRAIAHTVM